MIIFAALCEPISCGPCRCVPGLGPHLRLSCCQTGAGPGKWLPGPRTVFAPSLPTRAQGSRRRKPLPCGLHRAPVSRACGCASLQCGERADSCAGRGSRERPATWAPSEVSPDWCSAHLSYLVSGNLLLPQHSGLTVLSAAPLAAYWSMCRCLYRAVPSGLNAASLKTASRTPTQPK